MDDETFRAEDLWHVFIRGGNGMPVLFWLACIETDDAAAACAITAHRLREAGDTSIPHNRDASLFAVRDNVLNEVRLGWYSEPPELVVEDVG